MRGRRPWREPIILLPFSYSRTQQGKYEGGICAAATKMGNKVGTCSFFFLSFSFFSWEEGKQKEKEVW